MTSSPFVDVVVRLALGVEPVDAVRAARVSAPLLALRESPLAPDERERMIRDGTLITEKLHALRRSETCRFLMLYNEFAFDAVNPNVVLRLVEGRGRYGARRFVPRRVQIPLFDPAVVALEPYAALVRRPALYPGADYAIHETATVVRGRVERAGQPMRWARVEALMPLANGTCPPPASPDVIAVAHGDDRGEFVLILPINAATPGAALSTTICVRAWGPTAAAVPADPLEPRIDPHWDLPLEVLSFDATGDKITAGRLRPANYTRSDVKRLTVPLGQLTSVQSPFTIT